MILNLEKKGIPFILTSARSPEGVRVIKRMLGNHAPIIAFCGGLILDDDGNEIYSKMIPLKRALELKAMLDKDFPAVACNTFGGEKWIVDDRDDWREQREEKIVGFPAEIGSIKDTFETEGGIHKFLLMGDPDVMTKLAAVLARFLRPPVCGLQPGISGDHGSGRGKVGRFEDALWKTRNFPGRGSGLR